MVDNRQDFNNDDWTDIVEDVDAFWNEETQSTVKGKVVAINEMVLARRETMVAILVLTAPCSAVKGSKEDKETVQLEVGQSIGVVIKHKLHSLYSMVENQCEVEIKAKGKEDLDNGNSLWRYAIRSRGRRTAPAALQPRRAGSGAERGRSSKSQEDELEGF